MILRFGHLVFSVCFCIETLTVFPVASHEGAPRREEVPLSRVWLQMQVGDSAEVPHIKAHRYQQDIKVDCNTLACFKI